MGGMFFGVDGLFTMYNMCHDKRYIIFLSDCAAVVAGVCNSIDANGEPDKNSALMNVFHSSGVFALDFTFFHIFKAGIAFHALHICTDRYLVSDE